MTQDEVTDRIIEISKEIENSEDVDDSLLLKLIKLCELSSNMRKIYPNCSLEV